MRVAAVRAQRYRLRYEFGGEKITSTAQKQVKEGVNRFRGGGASRNVSEVFIVVVALGRRDHVRVIDRRATITEWRRTFLPFLPIVSVSRVRVRDRVIMFRADERHTYRDA